jgi:hypothetical protein
MSQTMGENQIQSHTTLHMGRNKSQLLTISFFTYTLINTEY